MECGRDARAARTGPIPDLGRHVAETDGLRVARDDHPLDGVSQLAHVVAPPLVRHEAFERGRVDLLEVDPEAGTGRREQVVHEGGDVRASFAQRRHAHHVDVEAEIEVLPEPLRLDLGLEVAVRRRDDARIDRDRAVSPQPADLTLLDHA